MRKFTTVFLSLIVLALACSKEDPKNSTTDSNVILNPTEGIWQNDKNPPIKFELVEEFVLEEATDLLIGSLNGLITDEKGNMYFLDRQESRLISLKPDGSVNWVIGEEGQGPGDFESPSGLILYGDKLLVSNIQGTRLDFFDLSGNFIRSMSYGEKLTFVTPQGFTDSGKLIVNTPFWGALGTTVSVLSISDSITVENTFEINQANDPDIPQGFSGNAGIGVIGNSITSGNLTDYALEFYDLEGTLIKTVKRDFDKLVRPGFYVSDGSKMMRMFGRVTPPKALGDGFFMVTTRFPTNISDPDAFTKRVAIDNSLEVISNYTTDFYNADGILLYSIEGDDIVDTYGGLTHVDSDGLAYVVNYFPSISIHKYRIQFKESD